MRPSDTSDLWWKTAVVYCVSVETYLDSDGDGRGDLGGLAHRLDYLAELGVTCLWLMPFYPSPRDDYGYDVADFYGVDPRYGHLGDFVEVVRTAKDRGMRVIVDLVVNHTSKQHPWFQAARSSPDSPYRAYYLWADEPRDDAPANEFPGAEDGVWAFDETAGQYYRHSFYRHQPDLDIAHPPVREEFSKLVGFWLALGIDGFRVDAVPHVIDTGSSSEHDVLRNLRADISRREGSALLLGEVDLPHEDQRAFFGEGEAAELVMQFDFLTNQRMFLALARQDATALADTLRARPAVAVENQWAMFVRNHDELVLDLLTEEERTEVLDAFAPEEWMRFHGRGIVRRLPPMLEGEPRRVRMVYSLLFSLPGTPVLLYGEEIGMGENPEAHGRMAVRSPMQWSPGPTGGFSTAAPSRLVAPVVSGGSGPDHVNVSDQRHDPDSLLAFVGTLARAFRAAPEIGWGELEVLDQPHACVLAHSLRGEAGQTVALHNFASDGRVVDLRLPDCSDVVEVVDQFTGQRRPVGDDGSLQVALDGYGYCWLRVVRAGELLLT